MTPLLSHLLAESNGTLAWLIDLACHWQWLFLLGLVGFTTLAAWHDRRWAMVLLAAPLPWLTASAPAPDMPVGSAVFSVASANVNLHNRDSAALQRWLADTQPDVVVLLEVSPEYSKSLGELRDYPFQRRIAEDGAFGIALLSRHPLQQLRVIRDAQGIAHFDARIQWSGQSFDIVAMHPMPPLSPHDHQVRNAKLRALGARAAASSLPGIVAGDLNATPWSSAFIGLADQGLRRASGLAPTWPAMLRGVMGIPIDHVLVTQHWAVLSAETGPDVGSDHLPILTRLALLAPHEG
ncbi:endonuclease/exonuclease/phosphatase family protein [Pseudomonas borbori]